MIPHLLPDPCWIRREKSQTPPQRRALGKHSNHREKGEKFPIKLPRGASHSAPAGSRELPFRRGTELGRESWEGKVGKGKLSFPGLWERQLQLNSQISPIFLLAAGRSCPENLPSFPAGSPGPLSRVLGRSGRRDGALEMFPIPAPAPGGTRRDQPRSAPGQRLAPRWSRIPK